MLEIIAVDIITKIFEDLNGRSGFKQLLDSIELEDPETYKEILDTNKNLVIEILKAYGIPE